MRGERMREALRVMIGLVQVGKKVLPLILALLRDCSDQGIKPMMPVNCQVG